MKYLGVGADDVVFASSLTFIGSVNPIMGIIKLFLIGYALVEYLTHDLRIPAEKITVLGQGVALDLYAEIPAEPEEVKDLPRPRAIWVGVLNKGDRVLFEAAAHALSECGGSLILIGPEAEWANSLHEMFPHVYVLGSCPPPYIPAYLLHADIGLMLYSQHRQSGYYDQNPLTLYEYAAAGLPIISTPHAEYAYLKPPVIEVKTPADVSDAIRVAITDQARWRAAARDFVKEYSWHSRFKRAEHKLHERYGRS